ncbi:MAG: polysaccharide biosynthesis tyrosine autokinase [Phycisphaeraceae bacterium]|nr:MAG: polysaccharide biosynthesis tyrosine autokinase [Phycisphaeraceae bacterium]
MSSAAPPKPISPAPMRAGTAPTGGPTIDPIKLLKKWKYVLMIAVVVGAVIGVIANYVWAFTYPFYDSTVTYEALAPEDPSLIQKSSDADEKEMERFMATQADRMLSDTILESVARDPRLLNEAPAWSKQYGQSDGTFDWRNAMEDLKDLAGAHAVNGTNYIRLKVTWKKPEDAAAIASLLSDAYTKDLTQLKSTDNNLRRDAVQRSINDFKQEIDSLTERRGRLIRDQEVTGIVEQATTTREKLSIIAKERNNITLEMRNIEVLLDQMNEMIKSEGGVRYSDSQRALAENSGIVQNMKATKEQYEAHLKQLRRSGFLPSHRECKQTQALVDATEQQISVTIERELKKIFDAEKDAYETQLRQYQAQDADMAGQEQKLTTTLQDLTRTIREINDISDQIRQLNEAMADRRKDLEDIDVTSSLASASRIAVVERPRIADHMTMPKIYLMIPLGMVLVTGLVGGVIFAAEFLDQRVKSASDVATMPRTKLLGTIPLADEDPTASSRFETIFRDAQKSVVAESFRQIRTGLLKRMDEAGNKTCAVVSCMPGSGSTSVVANLGLACASVDRKVLLVDANFRRPGLHRVLGLDERPGLGDVLAGDRSIDDVIQTVAGSEGLQVITAGSPERRVFERLGTQPMTELLAELTARYDLIFLDTAPAVVSGDAKALAQRCHASILVTRAMAEKRGMVARINNELNDAPAELLGVIVNAVRSAAGGYLKGNIRTSAAYHNGPAASAKGSAKGGPAEGEKERGAA